MSEAGGPERHVLVVANETLPGRSLREAIKARAAEGPIRVTVLAPVNQPRGGYVVYEDTRRAAAGRRLDGTLSMLQKDGVLAHGLVVEADPVAAVRDALAQLDVDEVIVSTHPSSKSRWVRRNVVDRLRGCVGDRRFEHVVVDLERETGGQTNVLVIANETVLGDPLLDTIRERAQREPSSFLIISPQNDRAMPAAPQAEARLRRALTILRTEGIEAHGQVAHPDPFTAAMQAIRDERVDELIVSTFPGERTSSWLRGDLVNRLRKETRLPVEHVVVEREQAGVA